MISGGTQESSCLSLEGEVTINEAARLKETLLGLLSTQEPVTINLEGITRIDTSGLQLLYAAHQTAIHQGKNFSLVNPSLSFMQAAKLAGLFFQSPEGYLEGCLWQGAPSDPRSPGGAADGGEK
ncbi:MAG: STAS domain-containing protein [bacterium]